MQQKPGSPAAALRWGERQGRWRRVDREVYADGREPPSELDRARARVLSTGGTASGGLAAVLLGFDSAALDGKPLRRRTLPSQRVVAVHGLPCTDALQTLIDLAATVADDVWEQALESALRMRLTTIPALERALVELSSRRTPGTARIRRVLGRRPPGAPPTESLLETLMVQLIRTVAALPEPTRQYVVLDHHGSFVARVDLCWPELGIFLELDGQHHEGQPVYDAARETAVVAATGWLPGRFTWHQVVRTPRTTARRLTAIAGQARMRTVRP